MSKRIPCEFCSTCSRPACEKREGSVVTPVPAPAPVVTPVPAPAPVVTPVPAPAPVVTPVPAPAPVVTPVPAPAPAPSGGGGKISDWFTKDMFDTIFPYADLSAVWSPTDNKPFWTYEGFLEAIDWMNSHPDKRFHGFGTSSSDQYLNKLEVCALLANSQQEIGDKSLTAPYPWSWPKPTPTGAVYEGSCGGFVSLIEGVAPQVVVHPKGTPPPFKGQLSYTLENIRPIPKKVLQINDGDVMSIVIGTLDGAYQPNFGLGAGTGAGVVFQPGLAAVSSDGTLYGDDPRSTKDVVVPTSKLVKSTTDPRYACTGAYCGYSGRNVLQLSYSYNYNYCTLDLFGDYRLVKYPNLLFTIDRKNWNGYPKIFGFPGPNPDGKNQLPDDIASTTPNAMIVGVASCLWFWMTPRSGRKVSCHECMMTPKTRGICGVNQIVNNQTGLEKGSWAYDKNEFYKRICNIVGIPWEGTIVMPQDMM